MEAYIYRDDAGVFAFGRIFSKFLKFAILAIALVSLSAQAQYCNQTMERGNCFTCEWGPDAVSQGGGCYQCGGFCASTLIADANALLTAMSPKGLDQVQIKDGVAMYSSSRTLPPNTKPFADFDQIKAIANVNPFAAMTLLRFHPKYYVGIPFNSGKGGSTGIATVETVHLEISNFENNEAIKATLISLPTGHYVSMQWELVKPDASEQGRWVFSARERNAEDAIVSSPYPDIEIVVSATKPYSFIDWSGK